MTADVTIYQRLITSEHADKPNYMAMVGATVQPWADAFAATIGFVANYDLDVAIGAQLDTIGQVVGVTRRIDTPITGVYFAFDDALLGLDSGTWQGPLDASSSINLLPDDAYRLLLRSRIANNHWDGSVSAAYALMQFVFSYLGFAVVIQDNCDMTMGLGLIPILNQAQVVDGSGNVVQDAAGNDVVAPTNANWTPSLLIQSLLSSGSLDIKPSGVRTASYFWPQEPGSMFAFDVQTEMFAGFDQANFATVILTPPESNAALLFSFDLFTDRRAGFDDGRWADDTNYP